MATARKSQSSSTSDLPAPPALGISPEKACFVIIKAHEFHAKVEVVEPNPGSNPSDEGFREVLEDYADDPTHAELRSFIDDLNRDEAVRLVALMWLGRGDYELSDWPAAVAEADRNREKNAANYPIGTPQLADYLEDGLAAFGESCAEYELGRL